MEGRFDGEELTWNNECVVEGNEGAFAVVIAPTDFAGVSATDELRPEAMYGLGESLNHGVGHVVQE